jgi:hypothetical protein
MERLVVEGWAPEYGASVEQVGDLAPVAGSVDVAVEDRPWQPVDGRDDAVETIAFVDGVERIDARLVLDTGDGPVTGICGSYGVGAVVWDRVARSSEITERRIERLAVMSQGREAAIPPAGPALTYRTESVPGDDPGAVHDRFGAARRGAEAALTARLASRGMFVIADGTLSHAPATAEVVGFAKSHRISYLPGESGAIIADLAPGQRTPLFTIKDYRRYSWYVCLARPRFGHSWSGIARCEAPAGLPIERVAVLADRTAAVLPQVASEPHLDPRAPQNLIPIAALERDLRHLLGDPGLVLRRIRAAVQEAAA